MNPNHNHQAPYQYQQPNNGPPQPPWQQQDPNRRTGWHDPRFSNTQSPPPQSPSPGYQPVAFGHISGHPVPPPPPPPPPPQYPPHHQFGSYGPPPQSQPQSQHYDTSGWGVRYNQNPHQQNHNAGAPQTAPALPPRPSSKPPEEKPVTSSWNRPALVPLPDGTWQFPQYIPPEQKAPTPPPRPPIHITQSHLSQGNQPQIYQQSGSQWNAGSTHANYHPPRLTAPNVNAPSWNTPSHVSEGTISPIDDDRRSFTMTGRSDNVSISGKSDGIPSTYGQGKHSSKPSTSSSSQQFQGASVGASALGSGPLSDWQLYQSSEAYDDSNSPSRKTQTPTEAAKPVKKFTTSSQPTATTPVQPSDGPTYAYVQPVPPGQSSSALQPKTELTQHQSLSPEQLPVEPRLNNAQNTGSEQTDNSGGGDPARSGTIDKVIDAWNAPLGISTKRDPPASSTAQLASGGNSTLPPKAPTSDHESQTDFPPEIKIEKQIETRVETKEVEVDPYADITDAYAATLKRFAGMLRQEASANTDEEKFKIFQGFVIRELRLRSVLYGVDSQPLEHPQAAATASTAADATRPRESVSDTLQTTSPAVISTSSSSEEPKQTQSTAMTPHPDPTIEEQLTKNTPRPETPPKVTPLVVTEQASSSPKDDSFVVVNAEDQDGEYSPGGRPRVTPVKRQTILSKAPPAVIVTSSEALPAAKNNEIAISPGANAPMTLDDYVMPNEPASPLYDAPIVVTADDLPQQTPVSPLVATLTGPLNFQPPRPTYTPFRQNDRPVSPLPALKERRPDETYNTMRQSQAAESGRMLANEVTSPISRAPSRALSQTPAPGRVEHEEAFIGLIRRESKAIRKQSSTLHEQLTQLRAGTPMARNSPSPSVVPPLTKAVRSLRNTIPKTLLSEASAYTELEPLVTGLSRLPDEFGFINATVITWDQANKKLRARLDSERSERQTEHEMRNDEMFEDNEIGYADIGALEAEFKLNEADKKYREDKQELESFVREVYDRVTTRIETELGDLQRLRLQAAELLGSNSACAGARFQSMSEGKVSKPKVPMTELMDLILQLHAKIEVRHQKIAEAQFERERRRKRLELSVLYTNGDTPAVKKLEKEFAEAQLRLVVEEARKRDERANKLMDAFDRAVVRGLAENQAWIEDAQSRMQLVRDLVLGSDDHKPTDDKERETLLYGPDGIREIMLQTQSALEIVLSDSRRIVRLSNSVDIILNEADYSMYLAEEKIAKSSPEKFETLKQDKIKEDDKIRVDFEARLSGVDKAPEDLLNLVRDINGKVGVDEGHKARIGKALEDAKRRNERHRGDSVSSPILGSSAAN